MKKATITLFGYTLVINLELQKTVNGIRLSENAIDALKHGNTLLACRYIRDENNIGLNEAREFMLNVKDNYLPANSPCRTQIA